MSIFDQIISETWEAEGQFVYASNSERPGCFAEATRRKDRGDPGANATLAAAVPRMLRVIDQQLDSDAPVLEVRRILRDLSDAYTDSSPGQWRLHGFRKDFVCVDGFFREQVLTSEVVNRPEALAAASTARLAYEALETIAQGRPGRREDVRAFCDYAEHEVTHARVRRHSNICGCRPPQMLRGG